MGTHDFRAVRSVGTETRTTVRTVHYFQVERKGELIECRVCADGFLYNMVRAMVGHCGLCRRGQAGPGGHPRHPGLGQPHPRRPHRPTRRAVYDQAVV